MKLNHCYPGDCRDSMRAMIADGVKVQCIVTSPPYWGLRDYGVTGQIGLEPTMQEYIANMVEVFGLCRELLADDGVLWLNLGDSMLPNKCEALIPHRVYMALMDAGWIGRQTIIWAKPNPMPESVTDRCTKSHEYLFLLTKSARYYFDSAAIAEPVTNSTIARLSQDVENQIGSDRVPGKTNGNMKAVSRSARDSFKREDSKRAAVIPGQTVGTHRPNRAESEWDTTKRNKRSVWTIATESYSEAHFATFPRALVEPCVLAGSRVGDIVFDPFLGSGTTAQVAQALGRKWLGCELNATYLDLQDNRTRQQSMELSQ